MADGNHGTGEMIVKAKILFTDGRKMERDFDDWYRYADYIEKWYAEIDKAEGHVVWEKEESDGISPGD